ncbi:hypothetical protein J4E93_001113 [Alternaria ventricosa]|uniref:uncharacterized protein n=1 Tax=Alternaria ventricosa TaxID=1187951 RepID=UPI0020C3D2BA|nr:uncharacterized protein J4E93_001113 [Alternaria ventricosa]KAI4653348.1 hypothetical protein J4E93_001113 [Alternaria ventricosa]
MSYYNDASWNTPAPGRQQSWEQPQPPSRSGTGHMGFNGAGAAIHMDVGTSSTVNSEVANAFASQFEEVDRAIENLSKSGKPLGPGFPPTPMGANRRESMPMMGGAPRPYPDFEQQRMGGPQRHHSVSEYDGSRSHSATNVQGFYQNQRGYAPRPNDADQMAQAKRRMAAQRERELRNYHQEQQYHRNVSGSGSKSDRSMSPNAMNEDERRELIARQHRALYGETSTLYNSNPTSSQDVRVQTSAAGRGPSPLAFDPFGMQAQSGEGSVQMPPRDKDVTGGTQDARANSTSSPSGTQNPAFNLFDAQQANRTSNSSPGGSPPVPGQKANGSGVAPIGTRPQNQNLQQPGGAALGKRANSPLPSPLGYNSYNASEQNNMTTSASMNPSSTVTDKGVGIWNNGPWSNTPTQGVQASSAARATSPATGSTGSTTARPASPKPPGGPATVMRRKAAADRAEKTANLRPSSTRAAGAGGSSSTMLRLYTDESPGLKVDPVVVMTLSVVFIFSVVALHVIAKVMRRFSA